MNQLSPILRGAEDNHLLFWCPGCKCSHQIAVGEGAGPRWGYNGNAESPTFTPSILVRSGHYVPGHEEDRCWCKIKAAAEAAGKPPSDEDNAWFRCSLCHSYVTDGVIRFLDDCTHELVGQSIALPPWPPNHGP